MTELDKFLFHEPDWKGKKDPVSKPSRALP